MVLTRSDIDRDENSCRRTGLWARELHQPRRARCIHVLDMRRVCRADVSALSRRRPQEANANVIERLGQPDRVAAHHFDVVAAFLVSQSQSQPADGSDFHPLSTFDETAGSTDVNDPHKVLTHEHCGRTTLMCHPRLTCCSKRMRAL